jgi:hypothetical protein
MPIRTSPIPELQKQAYQDQARAFEAEILGPLGDLLKARWTTYHAMLPIARAAGLSATEVLGPELAEQNRKLNETTRRIAKMVKGLEKGKLAIVWTQENDQAPVVLSIAHSKKIPGALGLWPFVPIILKGLGAAAVGGGILYMWNATAKIARDFVAVKKTEAENATREIGIMEAVCRQNPEACAKIAERLGEARKRAADTDNETWFEKLAGGIRTGSPFLALGLLIGMAMLRPRGPAAGAPRPRKK